MKIMENKMEQNDKTITWEKYYNPDFDWNNWRMYVYDILSEEFIEEFQDYLNWNYISAYQKLTCEFISRFANKVNWSIILKYYLEFDEEFIRNHIHFFDKEAIDTLKIYWNKRLSDEFKEEYLTKK